MHKSSTFRRTTSKFFLGPQTSLPLERGIPSSDPLMSARRLHSSVECLRCSTAPLQFLTSLRLCSPQAQALRASSLARPRNIDFVPTPLGICSSLCMSIGAAAPLRGTEHFFGQSLNFLFSSQQPKIQKICI